MTWRNPPKLIIEKKKSKPITPEQLAASGSEDGHQMAVFCWAAQNFNIYPQLKWLHAIPNGGNLHIVEAIKMVGTGTRSGVPDMCLPVPMRSYDRVDSYHGLYIENKKEKYRNHKDGGCSKEQIEWLNHLFEAGYCCRVCYTWQEAADVLVKYLEGKL